MIRTPRWYSTLAIVGTFLIIAALVVSSLLPFYWMIVTSIKPNSEMYSMANPLVPRQPTYENFRLLLGSTPFWSWFLNSVLASAASSGIALVFGSLAAYGISRLSSGPAMVFARLTLVTYLVPRVLFVIPLYQLLNGLGLMNSIIGLTLAYMTFTLPFTTWFLISFFQGIPRELDEAALVDGTTHLGALLKVVLPLAGPGLVATMIFAFTTAWNEFMYPLVLLQQADKQTLTVGLTSLQQGDVFVWGQIMAAGVLASIPVVLFFGLIFRRVVGGLSVGAVKG